MKYSPLALLFLLCACAAAPMIGAAGAGGALGWFATVKTVNADANEVLELDLPVKQDLCKEWLSQPHKPTLDAWCANLPSDTIGLARQWAKVAEALKVENDK